MNPRVVNSGFACLPNPNSVRTAGKRPSVRDILDRRQTRTRRCWDCCRWLAGRMVTVALISGLGAGGWLLLACRCNERFRSPARAGAVAPRDSQPYRVAAGRIDRPSPPRFQSSAPRHSMSWVTVIWCMGASASLTLAVMQLLVWCKRRTAWANLVFSIAAVAAAGAAACELWMMRAETPREFGIALRLDHVPGWVVVLSLVGFVRLYLQPGRAAVARMDGLWRAHAVFTP